MVETRTHTPRSKFSQLVKPNAAKRPAPIRMKSIKGVGRHAGRGYCPECGHTVGKCVCR